MIFLLLVFLSNDEEVMIKMIKIWWEISKFLQKNLL